MDKLTKEQRTKNMKAIKATGSKIETGLAKALFARGHRYRKNDKSVFGKPDLTFKKLKIAIFVDSEFWHGKDWETRKHDHKSNKDFWITKIERNIERDKEVNLQLLKEGWIILRFWGSDIQKNLPTCITIIEQKKMKLKEKISIDEFDGKRFQIRLVEPKENKVPKTYRANCGEVPLGDITKKQVKDF